MPALVVVDRPEDWPLDVHGVEVVPARRYLTDPEWSGRRGVKVFNLCRHYRYQSVGYYVSLLATARGHRPLPDVSTIQDLRHRSLVRLYSEEVQELVERCLAPLLGDVFTLSIYFGQNVAKRYQRLALALFNLFPAPFLRAEFRRGEDGWELRGLRLITAREIPPQHHAFVVAAAEAYFARRAPRPRRRDVRYDMAILANEEEREPPSKLSTLKRIVRVGRTMDLAIEIISPDDYGRLGEFDALFIRETTAVQHHTYRFASKAAAEGLVVIDDPVSIVRCTNKVFLAEALQRAKLPAPRTVVVHRDNVEEAVAEVGYPCILKQPDSSFSQGVVRLANHDEYLRTVNEYLASSELVIVQEFLPTDFDWRIGTIDGKLLFAARYGMAEKHWQIIRRDARGRVASYGEVEAVSSDDVPPAVLQNALAAAALMGDGFYGVDIKERDGKAYVIEVNDNPNLDHGYEDSILGDELYRRILQVFLERIERRKGIVR